MWGPGGRGPDQKNVMSMFVPFTLLVASLLATTATLVLPGLSDLAPLPLLSALASLILLARAYLLRGPKAQPNWILVDGSNVMHWKDGTPQLGTLREVIAHLTQKGFTPGVVFDANAGYKVAGRYTHDRAMGQLLGLPQDRVFVAPKGTQADPLLLTTARDLQARIVTNDRYRDWAETHPEVADKGHLIRGGYRDGTLWLDMD